MSTINGGDREVGMVLFFLSLIGDERGRDVAAQVLAKKWPLTVGASLLNRVYGPEFVPEFNAQLAFPWEKKISAYGDDAVFIVTQKLDGVRALIEVDRGRVVAVRSRKGGANTRPGRSRGGGCRCCPQRVGARDVGR